MAKRPSIEVGDGAVGSWYDGDADDQVRMFNRDWPQRDQRTSFKGRMNVEDRFS